MGGGAAGRTGGVGGVLRAGGGAGGVFLGLGGAGGLAAAGAGARAFSGLLVCGGRVSSSVSFDSLFE
jgi:hypothetical protein